MLCLLHPLLVIAGLDPAIKFRFIVMAGSSPAMTAKGLALARRTL
jgi:hypothetical protein